MHWAMPKKECMLEGNTETATSQSSSQSSDVDMNFINNGKFLFLLLDIQSFGELLFCSSK